MLVEDLLATVFSAAGFSVEVPESEVPESDEVDELSDGLVLLGLASVELSGFR